MLKRKEEEEEEEEEEKEETSYPQRDEVPSKKWGVSAKKCLLRQYFSKFHQDNQQTVGNRLQQHH